MQAFHRLAAAIALALPLLASAAGPSVQTQQGTAYISGGIGAEEQAALAAVKQDFNLHLLFATKGSGEFRADVALVITDAKDAPVLKLTGAGPRVFVKLAPGSYKVQATAVGKTQQQSTAIKTGAARELVFYWEGE
ncbi:hypothetical protein [Massilia sp. TS11]|uniref:hypothetical protein n=1 Tax=Massilia sp. TS11 TaxID=2908003 RepID=UPI001EDB3F21|nr:hypothetical protein [Massilia sp. TS11]MCG2583972.1 hypothetical protein [Massilia sp. TS11]